MRIKINGEVTAEILAEALYEATLALSDTQGSARFFNGNLYLSAYLDGVPISPKGENGGELVITVGESQPTYEHVRHRKIAEPVKKGFAPELVWANTTFPIVLLQGLEADSLLENQYERMNAATLSMYEAEPLNFIDMLNDIVEVVWYELSPLHTSGSRFGKPLAMPRFFWDADGLAVTTADRQEPMLVYNPLFDLRDGLVRLHWSNPAWNEVCRRVLDVYLESALSIRGLR